MGRALREAQMGCRGARLAPRFMAQKMLSGNSALKCQNIVSLGYPQLMECVSAVWDLESRPL